MKQTTSLVQSLWVGLKAALPIEKRSPLRPFSSDARQKYPETRSLPREEVFGLAHDARLIDQAFEVQRATLWKMLDECRSVSSFEGQADLGFHREFGKASGDRRYFFIKLFNERGWLFERSGIGWVVSRAEKIIERNLFIRHGDAYDFVTVLFNSDGSRARIASQRWSLDHFHPEVYASKYAGVIGIPDLSKEK